MTQLNMADVLSRRELVTIHGKPVPISRPAGDQPRAGACRFIR
jgi:hypothetical protein